MKAALKAVARSGLQINLKIDKVNLDIQNARKCMIEAEKRVCDLK